MNPTWPVVNDWLDLVGNMWIGLVVIAAAVVPSWLAARNHTTIKAIKNQVVNGHEQPLRADLDRAIEAIESLADDVSGLRKAINMEEDRRRVQIDDLRGDVDRMRRRP